MYRSMKWSVAALDFAGTMNCPNSWYLIKYTNVHDSIEGRKWIYRYSNGHTIRCSVQCILCTFSLSLFFVSEPTHSPLDPFSLQF